MESSIMFPLIFSLIFASQNLLSPENQEKRLEESKQVLQKSKETAEIYRKVDGKGLLEITQDLESSDRRIFLFEYPSDGHIVKGYLSLAKDFENKPMVLFIRGGNRLLGLVPPNHRSSFLKDFTVIATSLRGGINEGEDEYGGEDVNDIRNLIDFIPELESRMGISFSNSERYIFGASRGGLQMMLALTRFPYLQSYFNKAVSLSGPLDLEEHIKVRPDMVRMFQRDFGYMGQQSWIDYRNPIHHARKIRHNFPLLIIQGTEDNRVSLVEGKNMARALEERGCDVEYLELEGDHCLKNRVDTMDIIAGWLEK